MNCNICIKQDVCVTYDSLGKSLGECEHYICKSVLDSKLKYISYEILSGNRDDLVLSRIKHMLGE